MFGQEYKNDQWSVRKELLPLMIPLKVHPRIIASALIKGLSEDLLNTGNRNIYLADRRIIQLLTLQKKINQQGQARIQDFSMVGCGEQK